MNSRLLIRLSTAVVSSVVFSLSLAAQPAAERFDILIAGGSVLDGTGRAAQRLDVGIRGDRIVAMAPTLSRANAKRVINAAGRTVSPGFIDLHAHLEPLLQYPLMESALRQGVTLALGGSRPSQSSSVRPRPSFPVNSRNPPRSNTPSESPPALVTEK